MPRVAIVSSKPNETERVSARLEHFAPAEAIRSAAWLSSQGAHLEVGSTGSKPAHIYTPLNAEFGTVFVLESESARLFPTDFTVCWLAMLVLDMGPGGEALIDVAARQKMPATASFDSGLLKGRLPNADCAVLDDGWIRLRWSDALATDVARLETAFRSLRGAFGDFESAWIDSLDRTNDAAFSRAAGMALHHYLYSLKGANSKCFLLRRILDVCFDGQQLCGFDMAGGFGFMAAELAAGGQEMRVIDFDGRKAAAAQRFLEARGLASRVTIEQGDAKDISSVEGTFDLIYCFESLYAIGKQHAPAIYRESMRHLNEGGILVVNEGALQGGRKPGDAFYDALFTLDEFVGCLADHAGEPQFYDHRTGLEVPRGALSDEGSVTGVVRKGSRVTRGTAPSAPAPAGPLSANDRPRIWPEAIIDRGIDYELLPEPAPEAAATGLRSWWCFARKFVDPDDDTPRPSPRFDAGVTPELSPLGTDVAAGDGHRLLNPKITWSSVEGATRYRLSVLDETRGEAQLPDDPVTYERGFQVPVRDAFFPGHTYAFKVQAGDDARWGEWSGELRYRVAGTPAGKLFPGDTRKRGVGFDTKSPRYGYPFRKEILTHAECAADPMKLRRRLRPYFAPFDAPYRDFVGRVRGLGYAFESTQSYTPDDLGKPLVYLRYDVHVWDIAATYGMMDANLDMQVPADYHLTWELAPFERSYARDFYNLKKLGRGTNLIGFGFHTNPIRSWLIAERFESSGVEYNKWWKTKRAVSDLVELAKTGRCALGTYDDFITGGEQYFRLLSGRFKKHFPEARTLSSHGQIPGFGEAMRAIGPDDPAARERLESLAVVNFTVREELFTPAGFTVHHKGPHVARPDKAAWVWDPLSKDGINPEKWREIEDAASRRQTLFVYIHPSVVYRVEDL